MVCSSGWKRGHQKVKYLGQISRGAIGDLKISVNMGPQSRGGRGAPGWSAVSLTTCLIIARRGRSSLGHIWLWVENLWLVWSLIHRHAQCYSHPLSHSVFKACLGRAHTDPCPQPLSPPFLLKIIKGGLRFSFWKSLFINFLLNRNNSTPKGGLREPGNSGTSGLKMTSFFSLSWKLTQAPILQFSHRRPFPQTA